ncbi:hypothetical protein [Arthrobacter sp. StoSoilB13]|uniref:hypothetical protein n=1 Tax=Arthrobacter sp. StoSoilB13 TaxID=2830993 RepID=UPI001CC604B8|nr:hypothetical protein [Arthrobacter sp. StoSoilB13]BCW47722.1 hypothetical protein StoSoilB13_00640 [Arthrobacter sp. StoSoilB13]
MNRPDPNSADQSANKDDDAVWLDLVARLEATESSPLGETAEPGRQERDQAGAGPAREDAPKAFRDFDPLGLSTPATAAAPDAGTTPGEKEQLNGGPMGPRDFEVDDDDGAFVPEEPPSLVGTDPLTMLAWIGAVGGPLALLFTAMFWRSAPLLAILGIVVAFAASVVYLIMRLPHEKNEDDDGARI